VFPSTRSGARVTKGARVKPVRGTAGQKLAPSVDGTRRVGVFLRRCARRLVHPEGRWRGPSGTAGVAAGRDKLQKQAGEAWRRRRAARGCVGARPRPSSARRMPRAKSARSSDASQNAWLVCGFALRSERACLWKASLLGTSRASTRRRGGSELDGSGRKGLKRPGCPVGDGASEVRSHRCGSEKTTLGAHGWVPPKRGVLAVTRGTPSGSERCALTGRKLSKAHSVPNPVATRDANEALLVFDNERMWAADVGTTCLGSRSLTESSFGRTHGRSGVLARMDVLELVDANECGTSG
jgi:hypothetical protein